jgi:hypothetical protein
MAGFNLIIEAGTGWRSSHANPQRDVVPAFSLHVDHD